MTAADTPAPLDNPDNDGAPPIPRREAADPVEIERAAAAGGAPTGQNPPESAGERPEEETRVVALPPPSQGGRGRPGRRWVFHGEVETISGPEADRIRAELADVIRDLLLWAAGEGAGDGVDEEAA